MKLAIISDVHANLTALQAILKNVEHYKVDKFILLGDLINYGMRPNEVVELVKSMDDRFIVKIWGNHERAVLDNDTTRFSTDRGRAILHYTQRVLSKDSICYIKNQMNTEGLCTIEINGKKFLMVHGILGDPFWGKFTTFELMREEYSEYDYVLSGHNHVGHYFEVLFKTNNPETRNKKKTIFINPGSVGQPRNLNPCAQCGLLDTETTEYIHVSVPYDIKQEQDLYGGEVDDFYRSRLTLGI